MQYIILALIFGFIIGYKKLIPSFFQKAFSNILNVSLVIILIALGAKLGSNQDIVKNINTLGIYSIILAVLAMTGSIGAVYLLEKLKFLSFSFEEMPSQEKQDIKYNVLPIIVSLFLGVLLGRFMLSANALIYLDFIILSALFLMVFGVGVDLGIKKTILAEIKTLGFKTIIVPLIVLLGAVVGGIIAAFILKLPINVTMAIAAGCGFYSATGPIISHVISVELGMIAFLANLFREIITFIIMPFVSKRLGKFSIIAAGGATVMDTTLPVVIKCSGRNYALLAIINGMVLSAIIPVLVPFIASF